MKKVKFFPYAFFGVPPDRIQAPWKGKPAPTPELPVEDEDISTFHEAIPVPWFCGTRKLAVRWIDAATNRITKKSKTPGGKK